MRFKLLFSAVLTLGVAVTGFARDVVVTAEQDLVPGTAAFSPMLDAAAERVLYSDLNGTMLQMLDLAAGSVTDVARAADGGIDASWGADGSIFYVTREIRPNHLIYRTGHRYDPVTATSTVVLEAQHGAVLPERGTRGTALNGKKSYRSNRDLGTSVAVSGSTLIIEQNGTRREFTPVESEAGYLWPALSPDADKVAFVAAGKGLIVVDLDGNVLAQLGRQYEFPSWLNNDYLVAQNATDDGHQFLSSQIVVLSSDGAFSKAITRESSMTMQPSAAAGKIVYTTIDGRMKLVSVTITE